MKSAALFLAFALALPALNAQQATDKLPVPADAAAKALQAAKDSEELQKLAEKALKATGENTSSPAAGSASATASKVLGAIPKAQKLAAPDTPKIDPANWGKDEVRKLAVMDVEYGGSTESIVFHLMENEAPEHVANFIENCSSKAYNGLAIHRAIDSYLVQTGDPLTADQTRRNEWGTGGEEKSVSAELKARHKLGSVAMARRPDRSNPDRKSNGYQFYFALGNMGSLDGSYSVFGQVVSGLEILENISRAPADSNDCPLARIEVKSIKVVDHKGPLIVMRNTADGTRRFTKPASAKSGWERLLERIW
jgi:cyclophilin family peptidyl-prolyl cis-trans isomerase